MSSGMSEWRYVERWWNRIVHQQRCRDIWLSTDDDGHWRLEARQGERGRLWERIFGSEVDARLELAAMKSRTGDTWTDMRPMPPAQRGR